MEKVYVKDENEFLDKEINDEMLEDLENTLDLKDSLTIAKERLQNTAVIEIGDLYE